MGRGPRGSLFDLEKHFAFYGAYHSNPTNVLIHTLFVWPIFATALLLLYYTPPLLAIPPTIAAAFPDSISGALVLNASGVVALFYALFYISLDRKAGSLAAILCGVCWVGSCVLGKWLGVSLGWKVAAAAQFFCWSAQFIGHGAFEKRAPALLDNLAQALLMAPLFVLLEVLQKYLSYEPYPGFKSSVRAKIAADRQQWRASKKKSS